jgi:hypothetical protein
MGSDCRNDGWGCKRRCCMKENEDTSLLILVEILSNTSALGCEFAN